MKYIIGVLIFLLTLTFLACNNDGGESSVMQRQFPIYRDFKMYEGSVTGARLIPIKEGENWSIDSLYHTLVTSRYFPTQGATLRSANNISFEFVGENNQMLTFNDGKTKILSSYTYKDDSLFVLKDGVDPVYVVNKDPETGVFYRTLSVQRAIIHSVDPESGKGRAEDEEEETPKYIDKSEIVTGQLLSLNTTLNYAEIADSASMTHAIDTIMWCNVKYIYR